jgi:hypothetical protein
MLLRELFQKTYGLTHEVPPCVYCPNNMLGWVSRNPFLRLILKDPFPSIFLECVP